jgi:predicted short-subunit dehydrogenase-like oxidoreductase (DUF2520 family)
MEALDCVFIGAGAAGRQVLHAFGQVPGFRCVLLIDRSGRAGADFSHIPNRADLPSLLPKCSLLILAVQDRELPHLAQSLVDRLGGLPPGIVAHLSAGTPLDVLDPLVAQGWRPALIHPLQSLPREAPAGLAIPWWGLCAEDPGGERLHALLAATGGQVRRLRKDQLVPWHLSAAWVANLLPALLESALALWPEAERGQMRAVLLPIMEQSMALQRQSPDGNPVVAGPLRRGDTATLRRHLEWLGEHGGPRAVHSYSLLSGTLLERLEAMGERPLDGDPGLRTRLLDPPDTPRDRRSTP